MLFATPRLQPCPRAIAPGCTCSPASCKGGPYRYIGLEIIQVIHLYICFFDKNQNGRFLFFSLPIHSNKFRYILQKIILFLTSFACLYKPKVDSQNLSTCAIYIFFRTQLPQFFSFHDLIISNPNVSRMKSCELSMFHHFCPITSSDIDFFPYISPWFPPEIHTVPYVFSWSSPLLPVANPSPGPATAAPRGRGRCP